MLLLLLVVVFVSLMALTMKTNLDAFATDGPPVTRYSTASQFT